MRRLGSLSLKEIEAMNRVASDAMATVMEAAEGRMTVPMDDLELFVRHTPGKRMLDVGCGPARYVEEFMSRGFEYTGIDFSEPIVGLARARHPRLNFHVMSYRELNFVDESFDGLWSCCVLYHEPKRNVQAVLREWRRVLVPAGALVVVLPDQQTSYEHIGETFTTGLPSYFSYWELDELAEEMTRAGFSVVEQFPRYDWGSMTLIGLRI